MEIPAAAVVAGNLIAFLAPLAWALPVVGSRGADWLWVFYLGAFQIALAYFFLTRGVRSVPAFEAALERAGAPWTPGRELPTP